MTPSIDFVDSHFHALQMAERGLDVRLEIKRAVASGMALAVEVGVHPAELADRLALLPEDEQILRSSGIGPAYSGSFHESDLTLLRSQITRNRIVAVGEIGIDHHWNYAPANVQIDLFMQQLSIAHDARLPVIVHDREADADILDSIRSIRPAAGGVMHCFSSDWETASRCLDLGFFISFSGNISFRSSVELREVARKVPEDRLLVETDSPYLAPVPLRGSANSPVNAPLVYDLIAGLRGISPQDLGKRILRNARMLFATTHRE